MEIERKLLCGWPFQEISLTLIRPSSSFEFSFTNCGRRQNKRDQCKIQGNSKLKLPNLKAVKQQILFPFLNRLLRSLFLINCLRNQNSSIYSIRFLIKFQVFSPRRNQIDWSRSRILSVLFYIFFPPSILPYDSFKGIYR